MAIRRTVKRETWKDSTVANVAVLINRTGDSINRKRDRGAFIDALPKMTLRQLEGVEAILRDLTTK